MSRSAANQSGRATDLLLVAGLAVVTAGVLLLPAGQLGVEWIVGIPFLLVLPGYAIVAALFPEQPATTPRGSTDDPWEGNPDWTVRTAISLVVSAIVVALIGVALNWTVGIRLAPAVGAVVVVTLTGVVIAWARRTRLPPERRANPLSGGTLGMFSGGTSLQTITLVIAVLALVGSVAFVGAVPSQEESFSESYLLTEGENGTLVAEGYPTTFVAGTGHPLYLGIENNEHRAVSYDVVVLVQEINSDGTVAAQQQVDEFGVELAHGERTVRERDIAPTMTGSDLRLQFLIYKDGKPDGAAGADPSRADQTLQLWIDVVAESDR